MSVGSETKTRSQEVGQMSTISVSILTNLTTINTIVLVFVLVFFNKVLSLEKYNSSNTDDIFRIR